MSQIISIGDVLINLDQVSMLDFDAVAGNPLAVKLRVFGTSSLLASDIQMAKTEAQRLLSALTTPATRFQGVDPND